MLDSRMRSTLRIRRGSPSSSRPRSPAPDLSRRVAASAELDRGSRPGRRRKSDRALRFRASPCIDDRVRDSVCSPACSSGSVIRSVRVVEKPVDRQWGMLDFSSDGHVSRSRAPAFNELDRKTWKVCKRFHARAARRRVGSRRAARLPLRPGGLSSLNSESGRDCLCGAFCRRGSQFGRHLRSRVRSRQDSDPELTPTAVVSPTRSLCLTARERFRDRFRIVPDVLENDLLS